MEDRNMKRNYMKPTMLVVEMRNKSCLLAASGIQSIGGNANMNYRGAGNGNVEARSRGCDDDWDEDDW